MAEYKIILQRTISAEVVINTERTDPTLAMEEAQKSVSAEHVFDSGFWKVVRLEEVDTKKIK